MVKRLRLLFPALAVVLWMPPIAAAQDEPRGMAPADYYRFQMTSDAQIAPDGERVVFVRTTVADDRRSRETNLWMVPTDGAEEPRRFTRGTSDRSPRWAPDGAKIAFISDRDEQSQLYTIRTDGGEAKAVTELKQGSISAFEWLPDGAHLLLTLSIDPAVEDPTAEAEEPEDPQPDTTVVREALYRTGAGSYLDETRRTLWLLSLEDGELTSLVGDAAYNVSNAAVSPDGAHVAYNADTTGEEFDAGFNQDIHVLHLDDGTVRRIETPERRAQRPVWSPDGQHLLYHHEADRYEPTALHRIAVEGGTPEVVARWHGPDHLRRAMARRVRPALLWGRLPWITAPLSTE